MPTTRPLLDGHTVLVTGAGRGLGRGIAQALASDGATVVVTDLDLASAEQTAATIDATGGTAHAQALDVTRPEAVGAAIDDTLDRHGKLDGWVNNAGVLRMAKALDASAEDWASQLDVNARALFDCCRQAARAMGTSGRTGGAIVNVASNAGKVGYPNMAIYNASKAAVISLTRSLAAEWAPLGINVNAVCPGGVDTPMLDDVAAWIGADTGLDPGALRRDMTAGQLGRQVQPIEVGRVVAFLLSPRAAIIRGQSVNVDGGDTPY